MSSSLQADKGVVEFVKHTTRKSKFDFDVVAEATKQFILWRQEGKVDVEEITADFCRRVFADDYYDEEVPAEMRPCEASQGVVLKSLEGLSYDELMDYIAKKDEENLRKKEKVFAKVLSSLQQSDEDTSLFQHEISTEMSNIMKAYQERVESAEDEKKRREKIVAVAEERKLLAVQRELLRKRFDAGSDDSVGIDPFSDKRKGARAQTDEEYGLPNINVDVTDFSIKEVLESKEFNKLLDEIEADINTTNAPPKIDEEFSSTELREIFSFLDSEKALSANGISESSDSSLDFEFHIKSMSSLSMERAPELPPRSSTTADQSLPTRYPISSPIPTPDPKHVSISEKATSAVLPPKPPPAAIASKTKFSSQINNSSAAAGGSSSDDSTRKVEDVKSRRQLDFGGKVKSENIECSYNSNGTEIIDEEPSNDDSNDDDEEEEEQNFRSQRNHYIKNALSSIPPAKTKTNESSTSPNVWKAFGSSSIDYASLLELQRKQAMKKYQSKETFDEVRKEEPTEDEDSEDDVAERERIVENSLNEQNSVNVNNSKTKRITSRDDSEDDDDDVPEDEAEKEIGKSDAGRTAESESSLDNGKSSAASVTSNESKAPQASQLSGSFMMRRKASTIDADGSASTSSIPASAGTTLQAGSPEKQDESVSIDSKKGSKFGSSLMIPKFGKVRK